MESLVAARTFAELMSALHQIDVDVPVHPKNRKNRRVEVYALVAVLKAIPWRSECFPLEVFCRERPDFYVKAGSVEIGLEHTECISKNSAKERAIRADGYGPEVYWTRLSFVGESPMTRREILARVEADEMGAGIEGDLVERNWAEAMSYFIDKKLNNARKVGYQIYQQNCLILDDSWPAPGLNHSRAMPYLHRHLEGARVWETFSCVYIVSRAVVIKVCAEKACYYSMVK